MDRKQFAKCMLLLILAMGGVAPTVARTNDDANVQPSSTYKPKSAKELKGSVISYETRKDHWSVGCPTTPAEGQTEQDVMNRIFVFYNYKTGKFLSLGGWWGMRTVLSDVPYLFWLQRRNEKLITTSNTVRYPLNPGETTVVPSLLEYLFHVQYNQPRPVYVGSNYTDGSKETETYATFNYIRLITNASGDASESITELAKPATPGAKFSSTINNLDLTKQRIEAEIDLSTCKKSNETVLSIGSDITRWGWGDAEKHALVDNIHIFYNATDTDGTLKAHQMQVVFLGRGTAANGVKKDFYNVDPSKPVKLVLTSNGLSVSLTNELEGQTYYPDYVKNLNQNGKIQVGSQESTISHAIYNYVRIVNADGTTQNIVDDNYTPNAKWGGNDIDFDINTQSIEVKMDLTNCVSGVQTNNKGVIVDDENIISFGDQIAKWDPGYHIHLYYTQKTKTLEMVYLPNKHSDSYRTKVTVVPENPLYLRLDKNGLTYSNGDFQESTITLFDDQSLGAKLAYAEGNSIDIANVQGDSRSHATYNSVKVGTADLTAAFNAADKTKGYSTSQLIDINSQSIDAQIDLSTCTGTNENILSLGNDADGWPASKDWYNNYADSIGRIHLYYTQSNKTLTIWYVGRGQQMQFNRTVEPTSPLTIHFSKAKGLVIDGVSYFGRFEIPYTAGLEGEQVRYKNVKNNVPEIDADGNYIIDQENGHGITRVYENYIYANESRTEKRQTYFIASNFTKSSDAYINEGSLLAYTNVDAAKAEYNAGTYGDRTVTGLSGMNSPEVSQWSIDPVPDPSGQGQNLYTLSLTMKYDAESSLGNDLTNAKQFFLAPTQKYVYGPDGNKYYDSDPTESGQYATDEYTDVELTSTQSDLNYWKVISLYDYRQIMDNSDSELRNQVDASYLISDADFLRENAVLNRWTSTVDKNHLRIGYDDYYKTSPAEKDYTGAGKNKRYNHARYMAANIYNGGRGAMYQDITVFIPGWYVVHCQGMTNVGAKLFIERVNTMSNDTQSNTKELTAITADELATLRSTDTNVAHWPMDTNMPLYNSAVWMNDPYRKDADLAKYDNQVLLYVDNISMQNPATLRIGVRVDGGKDGVATQDEWTVFDNFRIQFGGASAEKEPFLILDEDKTSLDYIDKGVHPYMGKSLLLHRTFKENQWNTFILPVSLTKKQYVGAFGEESRLAELDNLTPNAINFSSVNIKDASDDAVVLKAGDPYIIKPVKLAGNTSDGTQEIWTWASNGAESEQVTVGTPYYTILGVTLDGPKLTAGNQFEHYNFTSADATYNGATYYADGTVYVKASEGKDGDGRGTMVMKGVYCKNYTGSTINEGHASLNLTGNQYAYVMSGNDMKRLPQGKPYGTKGLRCWFEYALNDASQAAPQVIIDGIGGEVTSIDDIQDDHLPTATRYANGVYNLNGQLLRHANNTDGLDSGIYIVNGKKILVNSK